MDIQQAKLTLTNIIKSRTDEITALTLALDLLSDTFKAEFTNHEIAVAEVAEKSAKISELNNTIGTLEADKIRLQESLDIATDSATDVTPKTPTDPKAIIN